MVLDMHIVSEPN
uniref:Uncharacterized protein n=1 Tax=Arundo donax TaxID=35708 RepID=A0A0A9A2U2_ARUDO